MIRHLLQNTSPSYTINKKFTKKIILTIILIIFFTYIVHVYFNDVENWFFGDNNKKEMTFFDSMYFVSLCYFTLGYGTVIPQSQSMKTVVLLIIVSAYFVMLF